jgi:hypothetical protein
MAWDSNEPKQDTRCGRSAKASITEKLILRKTLHGRSRPTTVECKVLKDDRGWVKKDQLCGPNSYTGKTTEAEFGRDSTMKG